MMPIFADLLAFSKTVYGGRCAKHSAATVGKADNLADRGSSAQATGASVPRR
jgi:hypothetical protein